MKSEGEMASSVGNVADSTGNVNCGINDDIESSSSFLNVLFITGVIAL